MATERTWEISDIDGRNKRTVTLAQFRAELEARKPHAAAIMDAVLAGDLTGCAKAQAAMRARFGRAA
jgi:hypothetical protein